MIKMMTDNLNKYRSIKMLIVSNPNSIFIKDLYKNVLKDTPYEIVILSNVRIENDIIDKEAYDNKVDIYTYNHQSKLKTLLSLKKTIKNIFNKHGSFDIINYQYVGFNELIISALLNKLGSKILYTFWGSDIFKSNTLYWLLSKIIFRKNYYYQFTSINLLYEFKNKYNKKYNNLVLAYFGDEIIEKMSNIKKRQEKKKTIVIGYNGCEQQRHMEIICALKNIKDKSRYKLCIPLTYGISNKKYIEEIENALKNSGFEYLVLRKYMNKKEMAEFVINTDIFIHNQISDALSNTVLENLYINNYVLNTSDIFYPEFEMFNVNLHYYGNMDNLIYLIENEEKNNYDGSKLISLMSWKKTRGQFLETFNRIIEDNNKNEFIK